MKKTALILTFGLLVFSCKDDKKTTDKAGEQTELQNPEAPKTDGKTTEIDWNKIPDLKNIGNFPFVTAPAGLKIKNEKDGLSEMFDPQKMENYTGNSIYTTEGKLGIISFDGDDDKDFSQIIFDKNIYSYFDKIGAKMLYKGDFPENETEKAILEKNLWSGKHGSYGLLRESDAPFTVYAFRNNGKKYVVNVQSNSAQGSVFIMEVKEPEEAMAK